MFLDPTQWRIFSGATQIQNGTGGYNPPATPNVVPRLPDPRTLRQWEASMSCYGTTFRGDGETDINHIPVMSVEDMDPSLGACYH